MPKGKPQKLRQASLFDAFPSSAAPPTPKQKKKRKQRTPPPPIAMPVYSSPTRNGRYLSPTRASTPEDDEVVDAIKFEASPGAGPSRRQKTLVVDSDSDDLVGPPATSSQVPLDLSDSKKRKRAAPSPSSSPALSPGVIEISSESDEGPPAKKSKTKAKAKVVKKRKVARGKQPARSSDEEEDDYDDDFPVATPAKRRFVRGGRTSPLLEEEDDGSPPAGPRSGKRKFARGGRTRKSSVEDDDLDEGEDSFMQEVDKEGKLDLSSFIALYCALTESVAIIDNRLRTRDKKSAFQKNLEKLKRWYRS